MSYPKQLLRLQPKRGFISDTADHEVSNDFWTDCSNVQFRDGFATRLQGYRPAYVDEIAIIAPEVMVHAVNTDLLSLNWWLIVQSNGEVHAMQAGTVSQVDAGLFDPVPPPWAYSSALINGIPILCNSLNELVYWDGSGDMQLLPDWETGASARFVAVLKYHVFAFNISSPAGTFESLVRWSSATEPGSVPGADGWTPTASNDAGSVELSDSPGPILCAYPLGDSLYVYKRSATYQIQYVGGQNVFSFRKVSSSSGALTPRSVCDIGGAHFIVTDADIVISDGTSIRSLGESRVKKFLIDQIDGTEFFQLSCTYNRAHDEVVIAYPSNGSTYCDTALVYDISRDAFGVREIDQATHVTVGLVEDTVLEDTWENRTEFWVIATDPWARPLGSGSVDSLITLKAGEFTAEDLNNGLEFPARIGRAGLSFGEPERIKFVRRVHVRTLAPYGELFVRVGGQMQANSAIDWAPEVSITDTEEIVNVFAIGRFIAVQIRSADGVAWKITGVDLEAEMRGYH